MKPYLVIEFDIEPADAGRDILLATLDVEGFDSFEETENGLKAYILEEDFDENALRSLPLLTSGDFKISYHLDKLEHKNWNEEWETHYEPITIDSQIYIRAPFHEPVQNYAHQIIITPKMSFGTGHHQTTRLMARLLLTMELEKKQVLDMGTGTGILAILASRLGAEKILAVDNFEWAVENTTENAGVNHCSNIDTMLGDVDSLPGLKFDMVLANINRNVLLEDMKTYIETLPIAGELAISGFFENDFHLLHEEATACGMELVSRLNEDRWVACHYRKVK